MIILLIIWLFDLVIGEKSSGCGCMCLRSRPCVTNKESIFICFLGVGGGFGRQRFFLEGWLVLGVSCFCLLVCSGGALLTSTGSSCVVGGTGEVGCSLLLNFG